MTVGGDVVEVGGRELALIRIPPGTPPRPGDGLTALLRATGVSPGAPAVVLVGGADGMAPSDAALCERLFVPLMATIESFGATLIDGGTDSGVIGLVGRERRRSGAQGVHLGIVAEGTVRWPGHDGTLPDSAALEPNHTHIVAVEGDHWGDETPWLGAVAEAVALGSPTVTVLANGGGIARDDVTQSLAEGRPVLVLAGTGRAADLLAATAVSPLVTVVAPEPEAVRTALEAALLG